MAAAARRALGELDAHRRSGADGAWGRSCAIVRDGERAVLAQIIELASAVPAHLHVRDPEHLRAATAAIPVEARGARRLLRQYLGALADELTG